MNNKLAVVAKSTIQPPPTKAEICEALFQRSLAEWRIRENAAQAVRDEAFKIVERLARKQLASQTDTAQECDFQIGYQEKLNFQIKLTPRPEVSKAIKHYHSICKQSGSGFNEKAERERIKRHVYGGRVEAMLKDAPTVKLLDSMLSKIGSIELK